MKTKKTEKKADPGRSFMRALRRDHAGLSRVLREIDTQASCLRLHPERAQPILVDAFHYLQHYHHAFHHPREDRLFARIRARDPELEDTLHGLTHEHETGEQETARLAEDLANTTPDQLTGDPGARLTVRINDYVRHTRTHMRNEESVFYSRAERVLDPGDWQAITADDGPQDPMADLAEMSASYPALAEKLGLTTRHVGPARTDQPASSELRLQMLALADLYGGLMIDAVDLTRNHFNRLKTVRGPASMLRVAGEISSDNFRFASQCVTRPSRWAINTGAGLVVGWLKPYMDQN